MIGKPHNLKIIENKKIKGSTHDNQNRLRSLMSEEVEP